MTLSRTRPAGVVARARDVTGMQSCAQLSLGGLPRRRGVTSTRADTSSMPFPDKDGLRGRHCRPEKRRYQHPAVSRSSRMVEEPVFTSRRPATHLCRASRVEIEMLKYRYYRKKLLVLKYRYYRYVRRQYRGINVTETF